MFGSKMLHQFKAFIFDLDGTLVDSAPIVELVMRRWCHENQIEYALLKDSSRSSRTEDTVRSVAPHLDCKREAEKIEAIEREELKNLKEIKGASEFLERLPKSQWTLATSSDSLTARAKLKATGMPVPSVLIGGDQVASGKPHPEAYLSAATGLGLSPGDCLAFEDSDAGISSAVAAGCSVMVVGAHHAELTPQIIGNITDFEELDFVIGEGDSLTLIPISRQNRKGNRLPDQITELPDELTICVTGEVRIRLMRRDDSKEFFRMIDFHRSDLRQWLSWVDDVTSEEDIAQRYDLSAASQSEGRSLRFFVLHGEEIVGMLAAKRFDWERKLAELSYSLDPSFRGRGIITQSCAKLISYCERSLGIRNFEIRIAVGNRASERIATNLGFHFIGIQERAENLHGEWVAQKIYANKVLGKG